MGDFKKKQKGFGGGHGGGFDRRDGGGRNYERPSWGSGDRNRGMHRTICAQCGKSCEVPFRPIEGRPVYCNDCFQNKREGGNFGRPERFQKSDFGGNSNFFKPEFSQSGQRNDGDIKRQLEILNSKIDRLINAMEAMRSHKPVGAEVKTVKDVEAVAANAIPGEKDIRERKKAAKEVEKAAKKAAKKSKK